VRWFAVLLTVISALTSSLLAQTLPSFHLTKITISGTQQYSEQEVINASGLKIGSTVTQADLQQASNKLGTSGVFDAVRYEYLPAGLGGRDVTVAFQLTDNTAMHPVFYDNLIWFAPNDLTQELRSRVPLFHDQLPEAGELQDAVTAALQQLLATKGVQGKVTFQVVQDRLGGPIRGFSYRLDIPVRLVSMNFPGASADVAPALQTASEKLLAAPFSRNLMQSFCHQELRQIYLRAGYLNVKFGDPTTQLVPGASAAVSANVPVSEGIQYHFSSIAFSGNSAVSSEQLKRLVSMKPGENANVELLNKDLQEMKHLYGPLGYVAAGYKLDAHLHEQNADFLVTVNEGPQYRMGELHFEGVTPQAASKFEQEWQLEKGAIYDDSYKVKFARVAAAQLHSASGVIIPKFIESFNDVQHTVDLIVQFSH
jgi:outer membrane protein insertion porin family